jgi:hypothetical protein
MRLMTILASLLVIAVAACERREPSTDAERLARGRQIVDAMSAKLGAAGQFTVALRGTRDSVRRSGESESVSFTDVITVRRPDRLHSRMTGEKRDVETWYDGSLATVAGHRDKVFAQARMPETIDRTLDALAERLGRTESDASVQR